MRQPERAYQVIGALAVAAKMLGGIQACVCVISQESQEVFTLDKVKLARLKGFCSQLVRLAGDGCVQPQYFASLGYPQDQGMAIPRRSGQLYSPATDDKNPAWRLTFHKQNGPPVDSHWRT